MVDSKGQLSGGPSAGIVQRTEQRQELHMTTELVQSIRILQMTRVELQDFIKEQLVENPVLEADDEGSFDDYNDGITIKSESGEQPEMDDFSVAAIREQAESSTEVIKAKLDAVVEDIYDDRDRWERNHDLAGNDSGISDFEKFVRMEETLPDHLLHQLRVMRLQEELREICEVLIEEIDADGYLPEDIAASRLNISEEGFETAVQVIQSLEPVGVGARSLAECLKLQLRERGLLDGRTEQLLDNMLSDVAANRIRKIAAAFNITPESAQQLVDLLRSLDPYPGRNFSNHGPQGFIVPDVVIEEREGEYTIAANESDIPQLRVSSYYKELRETMSEDKELTDYLNDRFGAAEWLIESINRRRSTIMRVAESIINHQHDAIVYGQRALKLLTEQEVADEIGVNVSTVSRAVDGKYIQCPIGIIPMRNFFITGTEGMSGNAAEEISAEGIKAIIRELIDAEDSRNPISDQKIANRLEAEDIRISRRTVAKYRESMGIEATSKRKRF